MILAILPSEVRTPLDDAGYPGITSVWRPMSLDEKAGWFDYCKGDIETADAKVACVRRQLLKLEGLEVEAPATDPEAPPTRGPFDPSVPAHFGALPMMLVIAVYYAIIGRTALGEQTAKN